MQRSDYLSDETKRPPSAFALVCLVGCLGRLSYEMIRSPITPLYAKHLGAPVQTIGLIVAAVTMTGIVVKMPAGALSDVFGFRRLMMAGAVVKAAAPFLYLLAFVWPALLVVRFVHGFATALYSPPASAFVSKTYPDSRGRKLGIYNAAENVGIVAGPVLGGLVLSLTMSNFRLAFIIGGGIGVLALIAMARVPKSPMLGLVSAAPKPIREALGEAVTGVRRVFADRRIRIVSFVEAGMWLGIGSLQAYLPIYALAVGIRAWQIGILVGAQGIMSIVSRPIVGRYSDRLASRKPLIVCGIALCIASLIVIPFVTNFSGLVALSVVFGAGTGIVTPSTMAMIGDLVKHGGFGAAMGVFGSVWDAGHAAGPILFGFLLVLFGYRTSWLVMAAIMAMATLLFVFSRQSSDAGH